MVRQGAVKIDGERLTDENLALAERPEPYTVQIGKRIWGRFTILGGGQ
jgi:hypothetical protein